MRLLAISDIHHNLAAVRSLRAQEENRFDAIVVAGDIGSTSASSFFKILSTFKCPTLYVYGNWDHELSYKPQFGRNCHLIHLNVIKLGNVSFTGFSGCPTNWGMNPIYRKLRRQLEIDNWSIVSALKHEKSHGKIRQTKAYAQYVTKCQTMKNEVLRLNRQGIRDAIAKAETDPNRTVIITHQRLTRLNQQFPGALLHIFGHLHKYSNATYKGTRFIDVAALDRPSPDLGNYVIIEIGSELEVEAKCLPLLQ